MVKLDNRLRVFPQVIILTIFSDADPEVERQLLQILSDNALILPISSKQLAQRMNLLRFKPVNQDILYYFLQKLVAQSHISINNINSGSESGYEVTLVDHSRVKSIS